MKINDSDVFESFTKSFVVHYLVRARTFTHCNYKKNCSNLHRVCKNDSVIQFVYLTIAEELQFSIVFKNKF